MTPLLLLHGALGSAPQLDPLKATLEHHGVPVFSFNFPGHGGVPFPLSGFSMEIFAEAVTRFIQHNNLSTVNIFGYSMGGYAALLAASNRPDCIGRIITLGTKFDWDPSTAEREITKLDPQKIREKVPSFARALEERHFPNSWEEVVRKTSALMTQLGTQPLLTEIILKNIKQPVLICQGDEDTMADVQYAERVAGILPRAMFKLLRDTPHPLEKVNVDMLTGEILTFNGMA